MFRRWYSQQTSVNPDSCYLFICEETFSINSKIEITLHFSILFIGSNKILRSYNTLFRCKNASFAIPVNLQILCATLSIIY